MSIIITTHTPAAHRVALCASAIAAGGVFADEGQCGTDELPCGVCDECITAGVLSLQDEDKITITVGLEGPAVPCEGCLEEVPSTGAVTDDDRPYRAVLLLEIDEGRPDGQGDVVQALCIGCYDACGLHDDPPYAGCYSLPDLSSPVMVADAVTGEEPEPERAPMAVVYEVETREPIPAGEATMDRTFFATFAAAVSHARAMTGKDDRPVAFTIDDREAMLTQAPSFVEAVIGDCVEDECWALVTCHHVDPALA